MSPDRKIEHKSKSRGKVEDRTSSSTFSGLCDLFRKKKSNGLCLYKKGGKTRNEGNLCAFTAENMESTQQFKYNKTVEVGGRNTKRN